MKLSKIKSLIENSIKEIKLKNQLNEQGGAMQPGQQMTITCPGGFDTVLGNSQNTQVGMTNFSGATQLTIGCSGFNPNSPGGPNFISKIPKR